MKQIFVPLTKVDAEQRLVYGTAVMEQLDKAGEVFDYLSSKPLFEKWSADTEALSLTAVSFFGEGARSYGNLREMHGKAAAGKLAQPLVFDDVNKTIEVCGKVTDDGTWKKIQEGVLTGYSIGGNYAKLWDDPMLKIGDKAAKRYTAQPTELSLVDVPCVPGATFSFIKADGTTELRKFVSVELTAETIPDAVFKACKALNKAYGPAATVGVIADAHGNALNVLKRAKELNVDVSGFAKAYIVQYGDEVGQKALAKGLYDVQNLASILCNLNYCRQSLEYEAEYEGDGSELPARLKEAVQLLSQILVDLTVEETSELTAAKAASNQFGKDLTTMKKFFVTHNAAIEKAAGDASNPDLQKMVAELKKYQTLVDGIQKAYEALGEQLAKMNDDEEPATTDTVEKTAKLTLKKVFGDQMEGLVKMNQETSAQVKNLADAFGAFLKTTPAVGKVSQNGQGVAIEKAQDGVAAPVVVDPKDPDAVIKVMKGIHSAGPSLLKA